MDDAQPLRYQLRLLPVAAESTFWFLAELEPTTGFQVRAHGYAPTHEWAMRQGIEVAKQLGWNGYGLWTVSEEDRDHFLATVEVVTAEGSPASIQHVPPWPAAHTS